MGNQGAKRKPLELQEAERRVHRSNAEKDRRREAEAMLAGTMLEVEPPEYLDTQKRRDRFNEIAAILKSTSETLCTKMDEDALARYVIKEAQYILLSKRLDAVMAKRQVDVSELEKIQKMEHTAFSDVQSAASAIGLTVTSRLKLIDLKPAEKPQENPFLRFEK